MTLHISVSGPRGSGKTTAAIEIGRALHIAGFRDFSVEDVQGCSLEREKIAEADAIVAKTTAPRVTEEDIKDRIAKVEYHVLEGTTLTIAVITMVNGFTFTGESACASPENFNKEVGETYAYADAFKKIWSHEAYLLKEQLYREKLGI